MNELATAFLNSYLDAGYTLTPLNGKIPLIRKWQTSEYDPFFTTNANFGVVLQDDDLVVDIDPRNGGVVLPVLANSKTFIVRTGGGGWHYYFKKPKDVAVVGLLKQYPGVEYKTKGQQVVGAGCRTNDIYRIVSGSLDHIEDIPAELLGMITKRADVEVKKLDKKIEYSDDAQTQERFRQYLSNCPVAVEGQNGDRVTFSVACMARDLGLSEQKAVELMVTDYNPRCLPPWPVEEINIKVNNAYKYARNDVGVLSPKADFDAIPIEDGVSGWEHDKAGRLKKSFRNTLNVLMLPNNEVSGLFQFNEFSEDIEFTRQAPWQKSDKTKAWTDTDAVLLKEWITLNYQFEPDVSLIHEAVLAIAKRKHYHPVKDYLHGLKWDGTPRIGTWLSRYLSVPDTIYSREVGEKVLCAAVSRIFRPGIKFDYLMVLEGPQGQGKSRICKALGGEYHIGLRLDPHNKDFIDYMKSKWIVEIEEMDFATKSESQAIKAFLSRDTDRCRMAYARVTKDFPRQCVFIGTYNPLDGESTYLKDPTGNRRFWPVAIESPKIDVAKLVADRDQLWAEAVVKAKDCKLFLSPASEDILCELQHIRKEVDGWQNLVEDFVATLPEGKSLTGLEIYTRAIGGRQEDFHAVEGRRIGNVMRYMGWEKVKVWNEAKGYPILSWRKKKETLTKPLTNSISSDIL